LDEGEDDGKIVRELKIQEEYMDDILEKRNVRLIKCSFLLDVIHFISILISKYIECEFLIQE
jgi:hypothetical protein